MYKSPDMAVEPEISSITVERYVKLHNRLSEDLAWKFEGTAANGTPDFMAVRSWTVHQPDYKPFEFQSQLMLFDREIADFNGDTQTIHSILKIAHPHHKELFLGIDVAGYLFGYLPMSEVPTAFGTNRFIEQAFTRIYSQKYPGIKITMHMEDQNYTNGLVVPVVEATPKVEVSR